MSEPSVPKADGVSTNPSAANLPGSGAGPGLGAGLLLRQARQAQGLHVAALAAAIKVSPAKLEALENERFELLPDPTFARALALAICRYLKINPEPVMSRLPLPREHRLEHINRGLATTFRDHPGRRESEEWSRFLKPALLAPLFVLVAALVVYVVPVSTWTHLLTPRTSTDVPLSKTEAPTPAADVTSPAAPEPSAEAAAGGTVGSTTGLPTDAAPIAPMNGSSPSADDSAAASTQSGASPLPASPLTITATGESWVEVIDAQGRTLVSRSMPAGETVDLDGPAPFKLRIGNAVGTRVTFKGQIVSLASSTKDNVARLELK
jgi:cytoskeleton protein RodZ